jgi:hypothetical protein
MAVPKEEHQNQKIKTSYTSKINLPNLSECPNCGEMRKIIMFVHLAVIMVEKKLLLNNIDSVNIY